MKLIKRMVDAALSNVEVVAEPEPVMREEQKLEMHALAAVARLDAALNMFRVNRSLPQQTLVDALLDVRHRLCQGLPEGQGQ